MKRHRTSARITPLVMIGIVTVGIVSIVSIIGAEEAITGVDKKALSPASPGKIEPQADRILREMGEYLKTAREFTFHAEITYDDVRSSGQKIQYGGRSDISMRRPDRLSAKFDGDERKSRIFYDGKTFTIHDAARNQSWQDRNVYSEG